MHELDITDPTFPEDLKGSIHSMRAVQKWVRECWGIETTLDPLKCRPDPAVRSDYSDNGDLIVNGTGQVIQVKHRPDDQFDNVAQFVAIYGYPIIDKVYLADRITAWKYFICNADITGALLLDVETTRDKWIKKYTRSRNSFHDHYLASPSLFQYVNFASCSNAPTP